MTKLTIEIDKSNVSLITALVKKLNGKVIDTSKSNTAEALSHLKKNAENGNLGKYLTDAVKWQKQVREERSLPFRD